MYSLKEHLIAWSKKEKKTSEPYESGEPNASDEPDKSGEHNKSNEPNEFCEHDKSESCQPNAVPMITVETAVNILTEVTKVIKGSRTGSSDSNSSNR